MYTHVPTCMPMHSLPALDHMVNMHVKPSKPSLMSMITNDSKVNNWLGYPYPGVLNLARARVCESPYKSCIHVQFALPCHTSIL